jgi:hypothetical protein
MCEWGDDIPMMLVITKEKSHTGKARFEEVRIDRCMVPIIKALNDAGILTAECCCGHGKGNGYIALADDTYFEISKWNKPSLQELSGEKKPQPLFKKAVVGFEPITEEQIDEALDKGKAERDAIEQAAGSGFIPSGMRFK